MRQKSTWGTLKGFKKGAHEATWSVAVLQWKRTLSYQPYSWLSLLKLFLMCSMFRTGFPTLQFLLFCFHPKFSSSCPNNAPDKRKLSFAMGGIFFFWGCLVTKDRWILPGVMQRLDVREVQHHPATLSFLSSSMTGPLRSELSTLISTGSLCPLTLTLQSG